MAKRKTISTLSSQLRDALTALQQRRDEIAIEIAQLKTRRAELAAAPITRDEAISRLDQQIAAAAANFDASGTVASLWDPDADPAELAIVDILPGAQGVGDATRLAFALQQNNINGALAFLFGDLIKRKFTAALDAEYASLAGDGIQPLTSKERTAAIAEIDRKIIELEEAEEALATDAEAAGIDMPRRGDLDPRAFLEVDGDATNG